MTDKDCIFCKIIREEIPSKILFEDENIIVINDINPQAKVHILMILKTHKKYLVDLTNEELSTLMSSIVKISSMKDKFGLENGFRVIINQGDDANQTVPHIHVHFLGGEKLEN